MPWPSARFGYPPVIVTCHSVLTFQARSSPRGRGPGIPRSGFRSTAAHRYLPDVHTVFVAHRVIKLKHRRGFSLELIHRPDAPWALSDRIHWHLPMSHLSRWSEQAVDRRSPISQFQHVIVNFDFQSLMQKQRLGRLRYLWNFWLRAHLQGRAAPEIEVECGSGLKPLQGPSPAGAAY
jgi:hypothetical protein